MESFRLLDHEKVKQKSTEIARLEMCSEAFRACAVFFVSIS